MFTKRYRTSSEKPKCSALLANENALSALLFPMLSPLWQLSSWIDIVILLGYTGVVISIINIVRKLFSKSGQKREYLPAEKAALAKTKKFFHSIGLAMIILAVLASVGIWYLQGGFPAEYIHLMILLVMYTILGYLHISIREKTGQPPPLTVSETRRKVKYTRKIKIIQCVNAGVLLVFCCLYVHSKPYPFHGIWAILAWAATLFLSYSPAFIAREFSKNIPEFSGTEGILPAMSIPLSWILVFWWLELGSGPELRDERLQELSIVLIFIFVIIISIVRFYFYRRNRKI